MCLRSESFFTTSLTMYSEESDLKSEEHSRLILDDQIKVNALSDDVHCSDICHRERHDDDAVVIVIAGLYFCQIMLNTFALLGSCIGYEDRILDAYTSLREEVFGNEVSDLIAFYIIHYEVNHVCGFTINIFSNTE